MASRARILAFGSAAALVLAGALCGLLIDASVGQVIAIGLITVGLGEALLLVFYEIGLSEDRERAREDEERRRRRRLPRHERRSPTSRWPRRPG